MEIIKQTTMSKSYLHVDTKLINKTVMIAKKYSYLEFLLDKTGELLETYLNEKDKDPPPWDLCKQLIEKSLAIANAASLSQGANETELKIYETQRIWQPLCLAMTMMSHLHWDLDLIQEKIPLHLQQILMEELLKGYGISQVPKPEDFDINKYNKRSAMVHILYNRWVIRTITKYEELKERDQLANNLPTIQREAKENQEMHIFLKARKVKELRTLSVDILEKSILLAADIEVPLPRPRLVTATEIIPMANESLMKEEFEDKPDFKIQMDEKQDGIQMKVPNVLDVTISVIREEVLLRICYDLGCYYFPKELYSDASRVFQKALDIIQNTGDKVLVDIIDYKKLTGYYNACRLIEKESFSSSMELADLCFRLEQSTQNEYKDIFTVLKEDNLERNIPYTQRFNIEKELYLLDKKDDLFIVCSLNFIRCCLDNRTLPIAFFQSLRNASEKEMKLFAQHCKECMKGLRSDVLIKRLQDGLRFVLNVSPLSEKSSLLTDELVMEAAYKIKPSKRIKMGGETETEEDSDGCVAGEEGMEVSTERLFIDPSQEDRIGATVKLRSKLTSCFDPETIKDILFEMHQLSSEKSHSVGYKFQLYQDIIQEIPDLLMFDTVHVFVSKAKQMTLKKSFATAFSLLNTCVETLKSYATKASPSCSVGRVKNLLYHELLWTELNFAETDPENADLQETMRRSKACITHSQQQDPPPYHHIYQAIVIHLLNVKEFQFLCDTGIVHDVNVVDCLQLGFHLSSVVCGLQRGIEVLRSAAKGLWETVLRILADKSDSSLQQQGVVTQCQLPTSARGPLEDKHMRELQCFIRREEFLTIISKIKDDTLLSILLSCLTSLLSFTLKDSSIEMKDSYTNLWPSSSNGSVSTTTLDVMSVLRPMCDYCLYKNSRNISWLRTIGDIYLVEGNYQQAMRCYLEVGSITTSFFSRPVPYSVWDEKFVVGSLQGTVLVEVVFKRMEAYKSAARKSFCFVQVIVFTQFLDPVDYVTAFKAIQERSSDDSMEMLYDCLWDVNILEYLIYAHDQRGEIEKRKIAIKTIGQPELNCRSSPEILQQTRDIRKIKFLRILARMYWT